MKKLAFNTVSRAVDAENGIFEAMISTENEDRAGDVVVASGMQAGAFMANPVVLFAHDSRQPPVAKALEVGIVPGGVKSVFQFAPLGLSGRADEVRRLWAAGFLNATSIGFLPIKSEKVDEKDESWWPAMKYLEWELVEFSIVPVPMNREALRMALSLVDQSDEEREAATALAVVRELKEMFRWQR
jgi:phage head maturation protease